MAETAPRQFQQGSQIQGAGRTQEELLGCCLRVPPRARVFFSSCHLRQRRSGGWHRATTAFVSSFPAAAATTTRRQEDDSLPLYHCTCHARWPIRHDDTSRGTDEETLSSVRQCRQWALNRWRIATPSSQHDPFLTLLAPRPHWRPPAPTLSPSFSTFIIRYHYHYYYYYYYNYYNYYYTLKISILPPSSFA